MNAVLLQLIFFIVITLSYVIHGHYIIHGHWQKSLVLSKLNFNDAVTYPVPMFLQKRMQHLQNATAGLVLNHYCSEEDVLKLGWLPTLGNTKLNILKLGNHALYINNWPEYLTLSRHNPSCTLRSSSTPLLQISLLKGTFQNSVVLLQITIILLRKVPKF